MVALTLISAIIVNKNIVQSDQPCIKHNDRGFTLGHGLFETILVKKGLIPALDYHWKRLQASALIAGIVLPFSYNELESMIHQLIEGNNLQNTIAGARVTITHGEAARGLLPLHAPKPNFVISVFEHTPSVSPTYSAVIVSIRKNEHAPSSRIKSTSYIDNILAKQEAVNLGYDEAILLNTASNIADGTISNVFMVKDGKIYTPPVSDGALPGVVRSILLEEFGQLFSITEKSISLADIMGADEVFLTNALMGVKSLSKLNSKEFNSFTFANRVREMLCDKKNYV